MDQDYDAIILGTGLKECILSGLLSVEGNKVLHLDRNNYYGAECASLSLNQLFEQFKNGQKPPESLGANRDYNVDMTPKLLMAYGNLVKALVKTKVTEYLEFRAVDGSYVFKNNKIYKAPATDYEALTSSLLGLFEKNRLRQFFRFIQDYNESSPKQQYDLNNMTAQDFYKIYKIDPSTQEVVGHAIALYTNDEYLQQPAIDLVRKVKLYYNSLTRFEKLLSPFIYPVYGLGELPQSFARKSAVYGGVYMLNKPEVKVVFEEGKAVGVEAKNEEEQMKVAKAKYVIGDPSYFPHKV